MEAFINACERPMQELKGKHPGGSTIPILNRATISPDINGAKRFDPK
jgi:hypothetical protein